MLIDGLAVRPGWDAGAWPYTVPAIRQIAAEGLALRRPVTVLIGANGSGKSTAVEGIAEAYGIDVRGGHGVRSRSPQEGIGELGRTLLLRRAGLTRNRDVRTAQGYFLRGETAHGVLEYMTDAGVPGYGDRRSTEVSHGESYLQVITGRFDRPGLYLLDEAEAPLSFESTLVLLHALLDLVTTQSAQVVYATHSPLVAALPGAQIFELGPDGITEKRWADLDMVDLWRRLLDDPNRFFAR